MSVKFELIEGSGVDMGWCVHLNSECFSFHGLSCFLSPIALSATVVLKTRCLPALSKLYRLHCSMLYLGKFFWILMAPTLFQEIIPLIFFSDIYNSRPLCQNYLKCTKLWGISRVFTVSYSFLIVCVCVWLMYVRAQVCVPAGVCVRVCTCVSVWKYACTYMCVYVYACRYMCVHV